MPATTRCVDDYYPGYRYPENFDRSCRVIVPVPSTC